MTRECSTVDLQMAIEGSLPPDREQWLYRHLDHCEACRAAMEEMAGVGPWCEAAVPLLVEDELDHDVPSREHWSDADFIVEHLEPSDQPGVLGRLGGYDVLEIIGRGGMGIVLKAFDRELKRCVAIKVLSPHMAQSSLAKKRFAREAQAAAAVVHPNVLAIHQVQPAGQLPFLVMSLVAGESLAQRLTAQGRLELKEILRIGMQAAAGLSAAHEQGLVHRDVKPANILLEKGVERAVLTDFGLARAADDVSMTRWGIIAGTPQYMSPEQARGEPLDGRSDLFSLGCILYEMATGVSPFRADSTLATLRRLIDDPPPAMASHDPELPPWFVGIVERLLEKEPTRRFGSAKEVSELLEGCLAHLQQPASVPLPAGLPVPPVSASLTQEPPAATARPNSRMRRTLFKGTVAMIGSLGVALLGMFAMQATAPPDISGKWQGEDWGQITLKQTAPGEYTGTYTDTVVKEKGPGKIDLKWSRIERRFNGTWREGDDDRFGDLSIHLVGNEIRGGLTTDAKSKTNPATPRLADLLWTRPNESGAVPTTTPGNASKGADLAANRADPEAALRESAKNLHDIMTAAHDYHAVAGHFPTARFGLGYDRKTHEWFRERPYVSWRVLLLPFLGEKDLFAKFRTDQPWDSENNRKLIPLMPKIYRAPGSKAGGGKTNYLGVVGAAAAFPQNGAITIQEFLKGTSHTMMLVEVPDEAAVEWTRPEDFRIDDRQPVRKLVGLRKGGFLCAFADAAPHFISEDIPIKVLRYLFNRNGMNPDADEFGWRTWDRFVPPSDVGLGDKEKVGKEKAPGLPDEVPTVAVCRPIERELPVFREAKGYIEPAHSVELFARVTGNLTSVRVKSGDQVKKGDLLMEIDPEKYTAELNVALAALKKAQAASSAKKSDISEADLDAAKAAVAMARQRMEQTRVVAPFDGTISVSKVDVGSLVTADKTLLATISTLSPMYVRFPVPQEILLTLRAQGDVKHDAALDLPIYCDIHDGRGYAHRAKLCSVYSDGRTGEAMFGLLACHAELEPSKEQYMAGLTVDLHLLVSHKQKVLLVPNTAISWNHSNGKFDYFLQVFNRQSKTVTQRYVQAGQVTEDDMRVVTGNLNSDDLVVIRPIRDLKSVVRPEILPAKQGTPVKEKAPEKPSASGGASAPPTVTALQGFVPATVSKPAAPATDAERRFHVWVNDAQVASKPAAPATDAERAIARLVLVFREDRLRRAIPAVLVNAGSRTLIVTTGPAVVVPDGTPPAIDRSFLEFPGRPAVKAQYMPDGTKELFVYCAEGGLTGYRPDGKLVLEVGDVVSAIITGSSPELSIVSHAARVAALGRQATLRLPKPLTPVTHYDRLIEIDRSLPEGTPLFKEGKLAGLVLLGSRFLGETSNKSYVLPVDRIAALCSRLEAGNEPATDSTQVAPARAAPAAPH